MTKPLIRQGLEELRQAAKAQDFIDITQQNVTPVELRQAMAQPPGNDHSVDVPPPVDAAPVEVLEPAPEEIDIKQAEIDQHIADPGDTTVATGGETTEGDESMAEKRKIDEDAVSWKPLGGDEVLRWKRTKHGESEAASADPAASSNASASGVNNTYGSKRIITAKIQKKMLDKEIPYKMILPKDLHLYHAAEEKEWADWLKNKSVKIVKGAEAQKLRKEFDPKRIITLRFVYRDKNASIRTPQVWLDVKAKARLCAQGSREPLAMAGMAKLDSPTVQRVGIMIFLQLTANFDWFSTWRKGDISSAFLQGQDREVETKGRLFLEPPRGRPLKGVDQGDLLEVLKSVYGLPDAPRAWWEEVTGYLRSVGFQQPEWMWHS